jgi:hypothetical protein
MIKGTLKKQKETALQPVYFFNVYQVMRKKNTMDITYRFSSRKALLLQQKICLRHFSLGKDPHEIAATMGIEQPLVLALLRKSRAIA